MDDEDISSKKTYWAGHWLDPVTFAQKWYEDHPEVLDAYIRHMNQVHPGWLEET